MMKVKLTGASGFLGKGITAELERKGFEVSGIERKLLYGSTEILAKEIENADIIINLAGAPILQRWTKRNKKIIYESRVNTTRNLVYAINSLPIEKQPKKFITASAIGIYKAGTNHDENSFDFDDGFVGYVVKDWEAVSDELSSAVQKIIFRIGLVLGRNAKTISNLKLPFKLGLGATVGSGKQSFPFVHEKDVFCAFVWAVEKLNKDGVFNIVAPQNISNKDFTKALAKALGRPAIFSIPEFVLKIVLGEASVLLTEGAEILPRNLTEGGFNFLYPDINSALKEIV
jgi:uncharacterized protein (TIGR01777 family)